MRYLLLYSITENTQIIKTIKNKEKSCFGYVNSWNYFTYGKNGIFAMNVESFKKYFYGMGVV